MRPVNVGEYEQLAAQRIEPGAWDYYQGGSDDEVTLRANRTAFERLRLRPRMLADARECDSSTTVLGIPVSMPVLVAPVAYQGMAHPEGELATAAAAGKAGTLMIASINASWTLEEIARSAPCPLWLQLYVYAGDLGLAGELIQRTEAAGYRALVLTVDRPVFGKRERDMRNQFTLPAHVRDANFSTRVRQSLADRCVCTWETVSWLLRSTRLPVLLKGILTAEDAARAAEHGVAGIIVSNHGGRQLDGVPAGIEALPEVVEAVAGRCEVYCDGGIRRGTDVLKALALGARAVLVGRPILWGLAVDGAAGVDHVLALLRDELLRAMELAGRPTVPSIDRSLVTFI